MTSRVLEDYKEKVAKGYHRMKDMRVAICSIVRDCGRNLERNIPVVEKLRSYFANSFVIIVENDSVDNTKTLLKNWSKSSENVYIVSKDYGIQTRSEGGNNLVNANYSKYRIEKMAFFRNQYLEFLEEKKLDIDFIIIIDLDVYKIIIDGIANTFGQLINWHVVASNGKTIAHNLLNRIKRNYLFYDSFALKEIGDIEPQTEKKIFLNNYLYGKLEIGMPMISVSSAFGGLAIYKADAIKNIRYSCRLNNDKRVEAICEHVSFHEDIALKGYNLIFINPSQIIYHNSYFDYFKYLPQKIIAKLLKYRSKRMFTLKSND